MLKVHYYKLMKTWLIAGQLVIVITIILTEKLISSERYKLPWHTFLLALPRTTSEG